MSTIPASDNVFDHVQIAEAAAPSTPATGRAIVYVKSDGLLYWKDDGGTEHAAGGSVADILDLTTAETDASLVLAPDGAGGVEFRAETGGTSVYSPWDVPSAPNAFDREGSDASAFTGATDRASVSHAQAFDLLSVTKSSATGDRLAGTDWAETMGTNGDHLTIGIRDGLLFQDYQSVGLYICDSTFTAALSLALIHDGQAGYPQRKTWTNTGTGGGSSANYTNPGMDRTTTLPIFLRIQRDSSATDYSVWVSWSGMRWFRLASGLNPGFTVARAGIAAYSATNTVDVAADVGFLRKNWTWGN